jgi:hypothetical protein
VAVHSKTTNSQTQLSSDQPAIRHEANMPLEFVVNTLDDATHVELDLEMLNLKLTQRLQKLPVLQPSDCALLLVAIASRSNGCIDKKFTDYGEAEDLMQESEDLQIALAEALDAKSFRSIRNLSTNPASPIIYIYNHNA